MPDYEARWYVVHTYSGYENKVAGDLMTTAENRQLQDMILDVKVPTEIVTEKVVNRKGEETIKEVEHKIYPGYVFVKMVYTDETWYVVRNIRGCTGFVGPGSKPVPLTEAEVYRMGVEQRSVKVSYAVGDSVRIIDGPLEDCVGVVDELNTDENYVRVIGCLLGTPVPCGRKPYTVAFRNLPRIFGGANTMAQKVVGLIKLQIPAGKATPAPPVGPALGQHGVNIVAFTKDFNERTKNDIGLIIPVVITVYADRSFSFITKTPPAAVLLKKACGIESGSGVPNKTKVAKITKEQLTKIAEQKMPDLNAGSLDAAISMIAGTARSMGITVVD